MLVRQDHVEQTTISCPHCGVVNVVNVNKQELFDKWVSKGGKADITFDRFNCTKCKRGLRAKATFTAKIHLERI